MKKINKYCLVLSVIGTVVILGMWFFRKNDRGVTIICMSAMVIVVMFGCWILSKPENK